MGYMIHHTIVVTGWHEDSMKNGYEIAVMAFKDTACTFTPIYISPVNGYMTFYILPDGSKEGWLESDKADEARGNFMESLRDYNGYLDAVELQYGGDEPEINTTLLECVSYHDPDIEGD